MSGTERGAKELKRPYPGVLAGGTVLYGGSQMLLEQRTLRRSGCGPVAGVELLRYLLPEGRNAGPVAGAPAAAIPLEQWRPMLVRMAHRWFPVIPRLGMTGLALAIRLDLFFLLHRMPYRARRCFSGRKLYARMEEQLGSDIPVILTIGRNFPRFWRKERLPFYAKAADGSLRRVSGATGHFVTVTGMDERTLTISSWGKRFLVLREDLDAYVRRHGTWLTTNMISVRRKGERR